MSTKNEGRLAIIGAVVSLVAALGSVAAGVWNVHYQVHAERQKTTAADRRSDLIAIQNATKGMTEAVHGMYEARATCASGTGLRLWDECPRITDDQLNAASDDLDALRVRPGDATLRSLLDTMETYANRAFAATTQTDAEAAISKMGAYYLRTQDRIGVLLNR